MKTKSYKHGKVNYKAYLKTVGRGYEVGFVSGTKPLFVGNFLHLKEAQAWYTLMNSEITKFSKKYWVTDKSPKTFYHKFITNNLYKCYYSWLDKHFSKYTREFKREFEKDVKKYRQLKRDWKPADKAVFRKAS